MKRPANSEQESIDNDRRDFLKNSVYAAYATPLITILLVDAKNAAASNNGKCSPKWCNDHWASCCDE